MRERLAAIAPRVYLLQQAPKFGNDSYARTVARHFLAAMNSDDQSLISVFKKTNDSLATLREAIDIAIKNYDSSDQSTAEHFGSWKD